MDCVNTGASDQKAPLARPVARRRGDAEQPPKIDFDRMRNFRRRRRRQSDGNCPERNQYGRDREELQAGRVVEQGHHLPGRENGKGNHDVSREHHAAVLVGSAFVQPAFDDEVEHGEAEARQHPQQHPDCGAEEQSVYQWCGGTEGGHREKYANVPDSADEVATPQAAEGEAKKIRCTHDADGDRRERLERGAHRQ